MATDLVNPISVLTAATAVNTTSGTAIVFTGIPNWVKRVTVMLNGVSTNGSNTIQLQLGSGSFSTSGYTSSTSAINGGTGQQGSTTGLALVNIAATNSCSGLAILSLISTNTWVYSGSFQYTAAAGSMSMCSGNSPSLGGSLDRIQLTTVGGTNTFDAGSMNIFYE